MEGWASGGVVRRMIALSIWKWRSRRPTIVHRFATRLDRVFRSRIRHAVKRRRETPLHLLPDACCLLPRKDLSFMLTDAQILYGIVIPGLVALLAVASPRRRNEDATRDRAAFRWPLLLALVVLLAHFGLNNITEFKGLVVDDREKWVRMFFAPALGVIIGIVMSFTPRWWWLRGALFAMLAIGVWFTTRDLFYDSDPLLVRIIPGVGTFILLCALEPLAMREEGPLMPLGLWIVVGAAAAVILQSGNMKVGLPLGAMSVAFFVIAIFAFIDRRTTLADGGLAVAIPTIVTMLDVRYAYAISEGVEIPWLAFALPPMALLCLWVGHAPWMRDRSKWIRIPLALILAAGLCAAAIFLANPDDDAGPSSDDPYGDVYDEYQ